MSNRIQVESILKGFESVEAVDVQDFSDILIFLALYNRNKLKDISERFNYKRLAKLYEDDTKLDHYHRGLISILHNPNSDNYMGYVSKVITESDYIDRLFIALSPELSLERLKKGVNYKITLHDCSECKKELLILKCMMEEKDGNSLVKRILLENEGEISKVIFGEAQNIDDKKGKFDFLLFIHTFLPEMYTSIFGDKGKNEKLITKVRRLLKGKKQEKNIARLYIFLVKKYSDGVCPEIVHIEKRYPTVKRFDVSNCAK